MVFITTELYKNEGVDVIKDKNNYLWVKMKDVQNGLGIKNISNKIRQKIRGIFEGKDLTKKQKEIYIRSRNEISKDLKNSHYTYVRNDIREKVIKDCRTIKKSNDKMNMLDKEK